MARTKIIPTMGSLAHIFSSRDNSPNNNLVAPASFVNFMNLFLKMVTPDNTAKPKGCSEKKDSNFVEVRNQTGLEGVPADSHNEYSNFFSNAESHWSAFKLLPNFFLILLLLCCDSVFSEFNLDTYSFTKKY